ncbi:hypothetical protein R3P38DRAFT_2794580 [Favolaschia claudopus]|uniref:Uncharacterized protein n=1 Tax=Favolaschia claudopus TaxID=2862362 RepID=A0AAW0A8C2_9AGAR
MTVWKNIVGTKHVPNGLQTMVWLTCYMASNGNRRAKTETLIAQSIVHRLPWVSGVLARFRDIDFNGFGKEIEEHTIQQGSVRVNNGMQQDIGELAAHSCPLERKGNQGHQSEGKRHIQVATNHYKASEVNTVEPMYQQPESMPCNGAKPWSYSLECGWKSRKTSYGNGELSAQFCEKAPKIYGNCQPVCEKAPPNQGIRQPGCENPSQISGFASQTNPEGHLSNHLSIHPNSWNPGGQVEFGGASHLSPPSQKTKRESYKHKQDLIIIATSYGNGEFRAQFHATGPRIHGNPLPDFETAHSIERNSLPPCENVLELSGIHCHPVKSRLKWVESTATLESTANNKLKTLLIAESKAL